MLKIVQVNILFIFEAKYKQQLLLLLFIYNNIIVGSSNKRKFVIDSLESIDRNKNNNIGDNKRIKQIGIKNIKLLMYNVMIDNFYRGS